MKDFAKIGARSVRWQRYAWVLAIVWTVIVAGSLGWNIVQIKEHSLEATRIQARSAFEKDVVYRSWNAMHGGVYAPITEKTQPNPYLDVPEREIITPSGKMYTLINPAYMTRQMYELAEQDYGIYGHITSLNPIRPENAADIWETQALQAFERGETEISSVVEMEGQEYMRLMSPLITEKSCLNCHAAQGYQEGDIRGGISVSVPMAPLLATMNSGILVLSTGHSLLWLMGLSGVVLGTRRLTRGELERKRAEEELEQANIRLQEMDRLKSVFLASMSHELRTPLNSIIGFTGLILQGKSGEVNERQREQLTVVKKNADHLLSLITDILDISKIEAGKVDLSLEEFSLDDVVREVVETLSPAANQKGLELLTEALEGITLYSDRRRVKQVLVNLGSNGVKFTDQGSVKITARVSGDDNLEIRVTDTGIGIKSEDMDKLFRPFQQIDMSLTRSVEGTGLGLHLCRKLADLLGGDIWAKSEHGRGSEFTLVLPLRYREEQK